MTRTRTATELQRNMGAVAELCHETQEPVYITRNGEAELVIMDANAFEKVLDLRNAVYARELRVLDAIEQGRQELAAGQGRPYADIRAELGL